MHQCQLPSLVLVAQTACAHFALHRRLDDLAKAKVSWLGHSAFLNQALNLLNLFAFAASYCISISAGPQRPQPALSDCSFHELKPRYNGTAIALHWVLALALIGIFAFGLYMTGLPFSPTRLKYFNWHKWAGMTILILSVLRLVWRITHRPELPEAVTAPCRLAAHGPPWRAPPDVCAVLCHPARGLDVQLGSRISHRAVRSIAAA
jgi:hypothetical protein